MVLQVDMVQSEGEAFQSPFLLVLLQLALPDGDAVPAHTGELLLLLAVAFLVSVDFLLPEVGIGFRYREVLASFMTMPEAAVYEDAGAVLAQHKVGMSWQPSRVETVAETTAPQIMAHQQFWLGVLRADGRHVMMPL